MFLRTQTAVTRRLPPLGPFNSVAIAPSPMPPGGDKKRTAVLAAVRLGFALLELGLSRRAGPQLKR